MFGLFNERNKFGRRQSSGDATGAWVDDPCANRWLVLVASRSKWTRSRGSEEEKGAQAAEARNSAMENGTSYFGQRSHGNRLTSSSQAGAMGMGNRLRDLRQRRGLTLTNVAGPLGVTNACVCQWESGRSFPRRGYLEPLAGTLGTSVSYLIAGEGDPDKETPRKRPAAVSAANVIRRARREIARVLGLRVSEVKVEISLPKADSMTIQTRLITARCDTRRARRF